MYNSVSAFPWQDAKETYLFNSRYTTSIANAQQPVLMPPVFSYDCDYGMIFIPGKDGISHNPLVYASFEKLALGEEVLYGTVLEVWGKYVYVVILSLSKD